MLIVGLGNPGEKYDRTRHNLGFLVADKLASENSASFSKGFKGEYAEFFMDGGKHYILKPYTYMNLSGESVQPLAAYYKIPVEDIIAVHDDLDIEFGRLKLKKGGNDGGHKGIRSMAQMLGDKDFIRLKMGIGKDGRRDTIGHVLGKFSPQESEKLDEFIDIGVKAVVCCIKEGLRPAMNVFNTRKNADKNVENEQEG
ncbi:peptidyl-tRNA hydrolase [Denitrovibrio acetiphilus DSM 12809]|uniref:Peptidyl-tRNA hydrolase n=1 Tax=Denitrovibrio acetiphilus (strain DSM 12809 / NBRC 114555 / N2460) TaxID=522772 RepID=D4H1C9_DENA2|nr:aminoacyl-tRNA hydrolase [Denitrovibrio acetiphilus]ADD66877.1 peptidyl-tRNA hydrolase [Denitrovibrio acetiphilus DSM 12809]